MTGWTARPSHWPRMAAVGLIWMYQRFISPLTPRRCRFYPTCSDYAKESLLTYGLLKGSLKTLRRIIRCHPWNPGGYDPVR